MLPHIVPFNSAQPAAAAEYAELARVAQIKPSGTPVEMANRLAARLGELLQLAGLSRSLRDCGVSQEDIPSLAAEAAKQWTANFNPRPVSAADFHQIYGEAFRA